MEVRATVLVCVIVLLGTLGQIANYPLPHLVTLPVSTKCVCVHVCLHVRLLCDSKCVPFTHCMLMHTCMGHVKVAGCSAYGRVGMHECLFVYS